MNKCPRCGAPLRLPPESPRVVKAIYKAANELAKLSPREVATGLAPITIPLALDTVHQITDWLQQFVNALKDEQER
jgi:hypothetical protein